MTKGNGTPIGRITAGLVRLVARAVAVHIEVARLCARGEFIRGHTRVVRYVLYSGANRVACILSRAGALLGGLMDVLLRPLRTLLDNGAGLLQAIYYRLSALGDGVLDVGALLLNHTGCLSG